MTITAAVDGSSLGNPGPAGWAWVVSPDVWDAGGWPSGTNNMGELTAVLELLRATADRSDEPLHILADSQYAINCITRWMPNWKRKGWKKADGKPVANRDILEDLDRALVGRRYRFEWVKGHAGHPLNEAADTRARAVAEAYQAGARVPRGPGFRTSIPPVVEEIEVSEETIPLTATDLESAAKNPLTIRYSGGPDLVLMDADLARRALEALEAPPSLF